MIENEIEIIGEISNEIELVAKLDCDIVKIVQYITPIYENGTIIYNSNTQGSTVDGGELIL